ncbi:expressed unknown protein [Seminavis robusta]|uniref:PAS domain-containing protein n=1 Tax=Seminavis robusta TaxID=568900 RepID=A0A9N8EJS6_9STRA|nr:expressed unknown protein [Seminavis robusta]|eukprot:Sro1363_g266370.1 n/a (388) ;mRNA; f:17572-18910
MPCQQTILPMPIASESNSSSSSNECKLNNDKQMSANSGYSADGSSAAATNSPPVYIGFRGANKKDDGVTQSNRREATELSFRASRAKEDLKKGGLPIPKIQIEASRSLEGCKVDMSKVKLVTAKSVSQSAFLIDKTKYVVPQCAQEYNRLFVATYQSYEKNDASQWDSSTSSVTSSESEDANSMPPPALVLPPRLEDALKANETLKRRNNSGRSKRKRVSDDNAPKLKHVTVNDALEASLDARVVTLSLAPYIVVHVNTAYTRLTGFSSATVLGKPLVDCLSPSCKDWIKCSVATHPISALHDRVAPIRAKGTNKHDCCCRLQATLVGPQLEGKKEVDTSSVTHYAVCFKPLPTTNHNDPSAVKKPKIAESSDPKKTPSDNASRIMG